MADSSQVNTTFDPFTQNFTLLMADGQTIFQVSIPDLDQFVLYNSQVCINYASQIGASIIMLVVVLLTTREAKRRSPIFMLNVTSLVLSFIRSLLQTLYWVGPFTESYAYFSGDYDMVPRSAYATSVAALVMTLLFLMTVELSLILQTNVVCCTLRERYRWLVMALSCAVSLLAIGFRFAVTVLNSEAILNTESTYFLYSIASGALIMETISIWFFCAIFVAKLAITLYQRKKLGLKQWGPMQIICIMGGCTMIIPSIFAILEYFPASTFPEAGSLALTLVAIFLPLSSVWASAAIEGSSPVLRTDPHTKLGSYSGHTNAASTVDRKGSLGLLSPKANMTTIEHDSSHIGTPDIDDGAFAHDSLSGVRVDRSYTVNTGRFAGVGRD